MLTRLKFTGAASAEFREMVKGGLTSGMHTIDILVYYMNINLFIPQIYPITTVSQSQPTSAAEPGGQRRAGGWSFSRGTGADLSAGAATIQPRWQQRLYARRGRSRARCRKSLRAVCCSRHSATPLRWRFQGGFGSLFHRWFLY